MKTMLVVLVIMMVAIALSCGSVLKYQPQLAQDFWKLKENFFGMKDVQYGKFQYNNCGDKSKELFQLNSLTVSPDPVRFPGTFTVGFSGTIKNKISSPVQAEVILAKKEGGKYLPLPCIQGIGSCNYTDFCELLQNVQCPEPLVAAGIPCRCPFEIGNYKLKSASFDVGAAVLPPGKYMASANLTSNSGESVGCYEIYVEFSSA